MGWYLPAKAQLSKMTDELGAVRILGGSGAPDLFTRPHISYLLHVISISIAIATLRQISVDPEV